MADQRAQALARRSVQRNGVRTRSTGRGRDRGASDEPKPVTVSTADIERLLRKTWKATEAHAGYQAERTAQNFKPRTTVNTDVMGPVAARYQNPDAAAATQAMDLIANWGKSRNERRGLLEQVTDAVKMVPSGVVGLGKSVGQTGWGITRLAGETGEELAGLVGVGDGGDIEDDIEGFYDMSLTEALGAGFREYAPLVADIGRSMDNTKHRITNPTEYADAWREGRIVDTVVEDLANAAMVGGAVSRVAGAGSRTAATAGKARTAAVLDDVARGTRQASTLGASWADAPAKVWTAPVKAVRAVPGGDEAIAAAARQVQRIPAFDPELRRQRQFQRDARREVDTQAYRRQQTAEKIAKIAPDPELRRASGVVEAQLEQEWARIPDERLDEFAARYNEGKLPEYQVSAQAMRYARDYTAGDLDPKLASKMDQVIETMAEVRAEQRDRSLAAGLRDENLLAEPLANVVDAKVAGSRRKMEQAQRLVGKAEARHRRAAASAELLGDDYREFVARGALADGRMVGAVSAADENLRRTQGTLDAKARARQREIDQAYKQLDKALEVQSRAGDKGLLSLRGRASDGRVLERASIASSGLDKVEADIDAAFAKHELDIDRASGARADARKRYERKQNQVAALGGPQDLMALDARRALMAGKKMARAEDAARDFANAEYARQKADAVSPPSRTPATVDKALSRAVSLDDQMAVRADRVVERIVDRIDRLETQHARLLEAEGGGGRASSALTRAVNADERLASRLGDRQAGTVAAPKRILRAGEVLARERQTAALVERLTKRLADTETRFSDAVASASATPEALPARFRTVRNISDWSADALEKMADEGGAGYEPLRRLAADMRGKDMDRMLAEGYDPAYLAGGSIRRQPKAPGQNVLPRDRKESFLRQRTAENIPFDPVDQLKLDIKQATEVGRNNATRAFVTEFAQPARDVIPGIDQMSGEQIAVALADAGFEAYNPKGMWARENPHLLTPDALALPTHIHNDLTKSTAADSRAVELLAAGNRKFKNMVLPFSVRWHAGNTIGGGLMAMIGGGVDPVTLARQLNEVRKRGLDDPEFAPLRGMSMATDVQRFVNPGIHSRASLATRAVRKVTGNEDTINPGPVGKLMDKSYRMNDIVDSMYRSAVYLAKRDQGLNAEQAVKVAIDAMGDYGKLNTFERRYVKQVLPFYPWTKHITTLAFRLPIEHPMRVVWTLHLADMFGTEPDPDKPEWEQGGFSIGGRLIGPNVINPFDGIGDSLGPAGVAQSISPVIKIPLAAATGMDASNMDQISRPGEYGVNPLSLGESAAFATNELSLLRALREIAGPEVAYDDLGKPRVVSGEGVYGNVVTEDVYGVPSTRRRVIRDANGEQIMQDDQPIRTAESDLDVALGILGFPRRKPDKPVSVPLELPTTVNPDGTVTVPNVRAGGLLRGTDGAPEVLGEQTVRYTLDQPKPDERTMLEILRKAMSAGDADPETITGLLSALGIPRRQWIGSEQLPLEPVVEESSRSRTRRTRSRNR